MKISKRFFALLCFLIFAEAISAQNFPNYRERILSDSLSLTKIETLKGSVDPDEYIVSPGDKIFVSISGVEEIPLNLIVNQESALYIPRVGGVDLKNTTLTDAKVKINNSINKYYKDVDVFISLIDFNNIKVSLLGDVKTPSSYSLPGNARLIDLITTSHGLNESSSYRNIKIVDKDGSEKIYDLLSYLRFGDKKNNPLLREGNAVIVDKIDEIVEISGSVKFPGIYEYVNGETVEELLKLAGGFLSEARKDSIEVVSFLPDGSNQLSKYYSYDDITSEKIFLMNKDRVLLREIPEYLIDRVVEINGFVKYPGIYKIIEDRTTLKDIIDEAGGFLKEASLPEASLNRTMGTIEDDPEFERLKIIPIADMTEDEYDYFKAKSRQRKGRVVVDFERLFKQNNLSENIVLKRNDIISVPEAKNYIILIGQVVKPGNVIYNENLTVEDYIELAGGFGWRALEGDVRIIKANTGELIEADDVESLEPGDTIWIPEDPPGPKFWDVFTTSLQILGQLAAVVAAVVAVVAISR